MTHVLISLITSLGLVNMQLATLQFDYKRNDLAGRLVQAEWKNSRFPESTSLHDQMEQSE